MLLHKIIGMLANATKKGGAEHAHFRKGATDVEVDSPAAGRPRHVCAEILNAEILDVQGRVMAMHFELAELPGDHVEAGR